MNIFIRGFYLWCVVMLSLPLGLEMYLFIFFLLVLLEHLWERTEQLLHVGRILV